MFSPLHSAAQSGRPDYLLRSLQTGENPNLQDGDGESPLHKAARAGNVDCTQLLLSAGCNPRLLNRWGQTSSQLALQLGHLYVATLLNSAEQGIFIAPEVQSRPAANNRKRTYVESGHEDCKKLRTTDELEALKVNFKPDSRMLTSVQDHCLLLRTEQGYDKVFIDNWISEFHGC